MKPAIFISLITAFNVAGVFSAAVDQVEAKATCGDLGVMDVTNLPEGVDPDNVRLCKDHPLGTPQENQEEDLEKRDCWFGDYYGCTKGYCWKQCAQPTSGQWCWTAVNHGFGDWKECSGWSECSESYACGAGDCKSCGCSC